MTPEAEASLEAALTSGRGLFILGCHVSNFDLAGIALSQFMPVPLQVLSLAEPPPGLEHFNRLREKAGAMITPISGAALRDAMLRLREGGAVITGVDRPVGEGDAVVDFFGAPASLPVGYVRIPLKTDCLVITACAFYEDEEYRIFANPPLEMLRTGDRERDIEINHRQILDQVEGLIARRPEQWLMFERVWDA